MAETGGHRTIVEEAGEAEAMDPSQNVSQDVIVVGGTGDKAKPNTRQQTVVGDECNLRGQDEVTPTTEAEGSRETRRKRRRIIA